MDDDCRCSEGSTSSMATGSGIAAGWAPPKERQWSQGSSSSGINGDAVMIHGSNDTTMPMQLEKYGYVEGEEDYVGEDELDNMYDDDDDELYDYDYDGMVAQEDYDQMLDKFDDLPTGIEATVPWLEKMASEGPSNYKTRSDFHAEILRKYVSFKLFDTIENFSDHHFAKESVVDKNRKEWSKRILQEWKILENDLPASIYVRVSEERMDLLRAAIEGPIGTPYHDGLYFFDAYFPADFPNSPPKIHYHSFGLRINPNLYNTGKVCLSLLNTWVGNGCEKWNPSASSMLQVLLSIQALVLNEKPYFNEPGFEHRANTPGGERASIEYSESIFLLCCKTMLYLIRKPPMHFEDLVAGHFNYYGHTILLACKAYMAGTQVGAPLLAANQTGQASDTEEKKSLTASTAAAAAAAAAAVFNKNPSVQFFPRLPNFKVNLEALFDDLLMEFTVKGADTAAFLAEKVKNRNATGAAEEA